MAFCPNCGTPNTDQAEKCVSCGFELAPKQKGKFKGTIMMSGAQQPPAPKPASEQAAPPASGGPAATPAAPQRNLAFEKTMLGGPAIVPPSGAPSPAVPSTDAANDLARAATIEGPAPQFSATSHAAEPPAEAAAPSGGYGGIASTGLGDTGGFGSTGGFGNTGGFGSESLAPPVSRPSPNRVLAIGCAVVLVATCVIGGIIYSMAKEKLAGLFGPVEEDSSALAWRSTLSQALAQVSALCQTDCARAANYFHPAEQEALLNQAKSLAPPALAKLVDPTSEARMLNATNDGTIATNLGLDPQLCVRLVSGEAKVVGCSVPNPAGQADMRIVHMSGIDKL